MKTLLTFAVVTLAAAASLAGPGRAPGGHGHRGGMEGGPDDLMLAGPGRAPGGHGRRGGMEGGPDDPIVRLVNNHKVAEKIGLSDEQREKIKQINRENRDNSEALRKTLRDAMEKQAELLKADKIDEAAVMAEIDKAFDARKEMAKRRTRRVIAIKSILTPEQVGKALAELKDHPRPKLNRENGSRGERPHGGRPCDEEMRPESDDPRPESED